MKQILFLFMFFCQIQMAECSLKILKNSYLNDSISISERETELAMVDHYFKIKDTANYFISASNYFNKYIIPVKVSSYKAMDDSVKLSVDNELQKNLEQQRINGTKNPYACKSYVKPSTETAKLLYKHANNFAHYHIKDKNKLNEVLKWAVKSDQLYSYPSSLHLIAILLYQLGSYKDAEKIEMQAIRNAKATNFVKYDHFEDTLKKMKERKL